MIARFIYIAGAFIGGLSIIKITNGEYKYIIPALIGIVVGVIGRVQMNKTK